MAPRAYWKGYLKLSLVTCPIVLYPASSQADKIHFHQINRKTGHRLRQERVDEKAGHAVDKDDKGRGYELSKGRYVEIKPEELKASFNDVVVALRGLEVIATTCATKGVVAPIGLNWRRMLCRISGVPWLFRPMNWPAE
jgi:hypothetical protein